MDFSHSCHCRFLAVGHVAMRNRRIMGAASPSIVHGCMMERSTFEVLEVEAGT